MEKTHGFMTISHEWKENTIEVDFPDRLWTEPLPGSKSLYAVMDGPIVLAAECDERVIKGDVQKPATFLACEVDQQYRTVRWMQSHYRTTGQQNLTRFKPLYEIGDARYTIYFRIAGK